MQEEETVLRLGTPPSLLSTPVVMSSNLYKQRNLVKNLVSRDFKVNYHGHFLGYFWSLLEPLALTGIFVLVFIILRGQSDTLLPLKIMIGILIFNSFAKTLSNCTTCLIQNSSLIKQVYFPREVFPTAISVFRLTTLCLSMMIIIPYMVYENIMPTKLIVLLPLAMLACTLLGQGFGMIAAVIQVRIRDLKQVIDLIVRAGFFLSGVFFGAEIIPTDYLDIYLLNPVAVYIEMARGGVLGDWGVLNAWIVLRSVLISIFFFFFGSYIFMRYERKAVKYI